MRARNKKNSETQFTLLTRLSFFFFSQEGDDEYSPKKKSKKAAGKRGGAAAGKKKKGGSDDDSDEDWGKGKRKSRAAGAGAGAAKKAGVSLVKVVEPMFPRGAFQIDNRIFLFLRVRSVVAAAEVILNQLI